MAAVRPVELINPIPTVQATIGEEFSFNLADYVKVPDEQISPVHYSAETFHGKPLPSGVICSVDGTLYGTPLAGTYHPDGYLLNVYVTNGADEYLQVTMRLMIEPALAYEKTQEYIEDSDFDEATEFSDTDASAVDDLLEEGETVKEQVERAKQEVWRAILQDKFTPETASTIFERPVTYDEVYHLMTLFSYFVIWNADDSAPAGEKKLIRLEGASEHFNVYDCGSCLRAAPKILIDHNRTTLDSINTAIAMAKEVHKRGWNLEFGGLDKMVKAAWVHSELLANANNIDRTYPHYFPDRKSLELRNELLEKQEMNLRGS